MNEEEIKNTDLWELYEKGKDYFRLNNVYTDTDRNHQMYNGDQWYGAKIDGIEKAQYNFIETIVNYKVSTITQNNFQIHFSSENYEHREFRDQAERTCEMLDKKASKVWEKDKLDIKLKEVSIESAVNDESIVYVNYDDDSQSPINEVLDKTQVQYANEQSSDIQTQPYIVIGQRKPVLDIINIAKANNLSDEKIKNIKGDKDAFDEPGLEAKIEKEDMCTLVTKMWKENGTVHFSQSTKAVDIIKNEDTGLHLYPLSHFIWRPKKGWSRGEGEVRFLIPNQLELNKTLARCLLSIKQCAYPQKVAMMSKIANPDALNRTGGIIKTKNDTSIEDVSKIFSYIQPASMSTDVSRIMSEIISITRELKNSSEIATGDIDPEKASGKAILAVQQASQQPLTMQSIGLNQFIEDLARIWLDMWTVYTPDGMKLEEDAIDEETGEEYIQLVDVPAVVLENLKGTVKVDVTPRSPYDRYAQELSLENMYKMGAFNPQKIAETRLYAEALPDDSVMPKQKVLEICDKVDEQQEQIAQAEAETRLMQERYNQFINKTPEEQDAEMEQAQAQVDAVQEQPINPEQ